MVAVIASPQPAFLDRGRISVAILGKEAASKNAVEKNVCAVIGIRHR
jgi:hypothetical protein